MKRLPCPIGQQIPKPCRAGGTSPSALHTCSRLSIPTTLKTLVALLMITPLARKSGFHFTIKVVPVHMIKNSLYRRTFSRSWNLSPSLILNPSQPASPHRSFSSPERPVFCITFHRYKNRSFTSLSILLRILQTL
jgi:hypothetical protein